VTTTGDLWPDLYVVNDFDAKTFIGIMATHLHDVAREDGVEDIGAGRVFRGLILTMTARKRPTLPTCGRQPVSAFPSRRFFRRMPDQKARALYRKHAKATVCTETSGAVLKTPVHGPERPGTLVVASDAWDFNHDGFRICTCQRDGFGTIREDLNSFSGDRWWPIPRHEAKPSHEYGKVGMPSTSLFG